jgi:hypothetical protein
VRNALPVVAVVVLALAPGAAATAGAAPARQGVAVIPGSPPALKDGAAKRRLALDKQASDLFNGAFGHVRATVEGCRVSPRPPRVTLTDADPSPELLAALSVLRRPAVAADQLPDPPPPFLGRGVYARYIRVAHSAAGQELLVVASQNSNLAVTVSPHCVAATASLLRKRLFGKPAAIRHRALGLLKRFQASFGHEIDPHEGVFLLSLGPDGRISSGTGGEPLIRFRSHGLFLVSGRSSDNGASISGLLPDGVASITVQMPRRVSHGRNYKATTYPRSIRRTVGVQRNVVSFHVPRAPLDVFAARVTWRAADGHIIRTVHGH